MKTKINAALICLAAAIALIVITIALPALRQDASNTIITDMVVDSEQLVRRYGMTIACLYYIHGDYRGWPTREDHRRYVRYLQEHGVEVAFKYYDEGGYFTMLIPGTKAAQVRELDEKAAAFGINRPETMEELRWLSAAQSRRRANE